MTEDATARVTRALTEHQQAAEHATEARDALHAAIVAALQAGVRQADLARLTGYTREHIRQMARAADAG